MERRDDPPKRRLPRINFRPLLFCAMGLCFGIFLYCRIRFGGLAATDFLFLAAFALFALCPFTRKRVFAVVLCILIAAGVGAACMHAYTQRFLSGREAGYYTVEGTVEEFTVYSGYTDVLLGSLRFDGERAGGKMTVRIPSEEVRAGDVVYFRGKIERSGLPGPDVSSLSSFLDDARYNAGETDAEIVGTGWNALLRLNSAVYDVLFRTLERGQAAVSYALLTGNSDVLDQGFRETVQQGGIAHIFAVSGLHIGILYGVALALGKPLKRYAIFPALALTACYAGMCGFSVSVLRALLMCGVHACAAFFRRKADFLNGLSVAAIAVLLISPSQWLSSGFRLSFGACAGLALFSGAFTRGLRRLHTPAWLARLFAASASVQLFTFPVLLESFGYVSVWGTLLNLVLIPLMPVFYLGVLLPVCFALAVPSAASVVLAVPDALCSLLLYALLYLDVSLLVTGFSLGAGNAVWVAGCIFLSERVRMGTRARLGSAAFLCVLLAVALVARNIVPGGCKISVYERNDGLAALIRTPEANVLVIDDGITLSDCRSFLARNYGGTFDAVFLIGEDAAAAANVAAFLGARALYLAEETDTGLRETPVVFGDEAQVRGLRFRFETATKLVLLCEDVAVEFDFTQKAVLGADLSVEKGSGGLNFFLRHGIIKAV